MEPAASLDWPHWLTRHVGARLAEARLRRHLDHAALSDRTGIAVSALRECEDGKTPLPVSSLAVLAQALECPLSSFFSGLPRELAPEFPGTPAADLDAPPGDCAVSHETMELVRTFDGITDPQLRRHLSALTRSIADAD